MSAQSGPESAREEHGAVEETGVNGAGPGPTDTVQASWKAPQEPPQRDPRGGRRRSWVTVGFALGLGASLAWLAVQTVLRVSSMLTLLLLAVFVAISLEPLVVWFTRRGLRRGWAVAIVLTGFIVVLGGFLALVIPLVAKEIKTRYEVFLHTLEDVGHETFFDLVEFPPLDTDDEEEEFGRLVATRDGPLAALTAAEDVTGAVRGRWVNAGVDLPRPTTVALRCRTRYRGGATDVISVGFPAAVLSRVYGGIFWAPSEPGTSSAHRALPATPGFPVGPAQYGRSGIPSPGRHRGPAGRGRGGGRGAPDVA